MASWEHQVLATDLWLAHRDAHCRNFYRRFSDTAKDVDPDTRLKPPRYWLVHTFAQVLIRDVRLLDGEPERTALSWPKADGRSAAAGLHICTTASDSDATLGGLVQFIDNPNLTEAVERELLRVEEVLYERVPAPPAQRST